MDINTIDLSATPTTDSPLTVSAYDDTTFDTAPSTAARSERRSKRQRSDSDSHSDYEPPDTQKSAGASWSSKPSCTPSSVHTHGSSLPTRSLIGRKRKKNERQFEDTVPKDVWDGSIEDLMAKPVGTLSQEQMHWRRRAMSATKSRARRARQADEKAAVLTKVKNLEASLAALQSNGHDSASPKATHSEIGDQADQVLNRLDTSADSSEPMNIAEWRARKEQWESERRNLESGLEHTEERVRSLVKRNSSLRQKVTSLSADNDSLMRGCQYSVLQGQQLQSQIDRLVPTLSSVWHKYEALRMRTLNTEHTNVYNGLGVMDSLQSSATSLSPYPYNLDDNPSVTPEGSVFAQWGPQALTPTTQAGDSSLHLTDVDVPRFVFDAQQDGVPASGDLDSNTDANLWPNADESAIWDLAVAPRTPEPEGTLSTRATTDIGTDFSIDMDPVNAHINIMRSSPETTFDADLWLTDAAKEERDPSAAMSPASIILNSLFKTRTTTPSKDDI
ncbi:hypothetical protein I316_06621 [Kwoniella heveanensis BCC8398]|uniref:Uncharacterized protein n=1 Tax=Kwoniella heveanensis BCC8398 TaxID=1296120 RepID=A0A1B9GL54_9TREE|nr:hypothetical protein I316_06621 [Kwoniella heveanensis BCC8398]